MEGNMFSWQWILKVHEIFSGMIIGFYDFHSCIMHVIDHFEPDILYNNNNQREMHDTWSICRLMLMDTK